MHRILTQQEWEALADAEAGMYANSGAFGVTDVRDRLESDWLATMWDDAMSGVELVFEGVDPQSEEAATQIDMEVARRVAAAQHFLVFGELPASVKA